MLRAVIGSLGTLGCKLPGEAETRKPQTLDLGLSIRFRLEGLGHSLCPGSAIRVSNSSAGADVDDEVCK